MKIKRLKQVWIGSYLMDIEWDDKTYNSDFCFTDCKIVIGCKSKKENEIFEVLMHEITEAYCSIFYLRINVPNGDYLFNYNHKEFNILNQMVSKTILEFIS